MNLLIDTFLFYFGDLDFEVANLHLRLLRSPSNGIVRCSSRFLAALLGLLIEFFLVALHRRLKAVQRNRCVVLIALTDKPIMPIDLRDRDQSIRLVLINNSLVIDLAALRVDVLLAAWPDLFCHWV